MRRFSLLLVLVVAACGGGGGDDPDARPAIDGSSIDAGPDANPDMPLTLADTGLCLDASCSQISPDVMEFTPQFILWSDGATKRRWIYLPPGTQIDTSNMDYWQFPEGTKVWKEFTRDGVRVETRLMQKIGPEQGDWYYASFVWNQAQDATTIFDSAAGNDNANGTQHDVPSRTKCRQCHDRTPGRIIGVSAILMDHSLDQGSTELNLDKLISMSLLTVNPTSAGGIGPFFPLPGNATAQAALGYLHTNCGNCHNATSDVHNNVNVIWRLGVGDLTSVQTTQAYITAVGVANQIPLPGASAIIAPSNPDASAAHLRMNTTDTSIMMPKVGHEDIDTVGVATVDAWINTF